MSNHPKFLRRSRLNRFSTADFDIYRGTTPFPLSDQQLTSTTIPRLGKRDLQQGGSLIIIADIIVLSLLLGTAFIFAVYEVSRRRKKRKRREQKQKELFPMHTVNIEALEGPSNSNTSTESIQSTNQGTWMTDNINSFTENDNAEETLLPKAPPTSPTTPVFPASPLFGRWKKSSIIAPTTDPQSYGDPYPSGESSWMNTWVHRNRQKGYHSRGSSLFSMSHYSQPSISSILSGVRNSSFVRLSDSTYLNGPALSDSRSAVLARELTRSASTSTQAAQRNLQRKASKSKSFALIRRKSESDILGGQENSQKAVSNEIPAVPAPIL